MCCQDSLLSLIIVSIVWAQHGKLVFTIFSCAKSCGVFLFVSFSNCGFFVPELLSCIHALHSNWLLCTFARFYWLNRFVLGNIRAPNATHIISVHTYITSCNWVWLLKVTGNSCTHACILTIFVHQTTQWWFSAKLEHWQSFFTSKPRLVCTSYRFLQFYNATGRDGWYKLRCGAYCSWI